MELSRGIKETVNQTNQSGRREMGSWVGRENPGQCGGPHGWGWLKGPTVRQGRLSGKLRLRVGCGLQWGLLQQEKLPVSQENLLESGAGAEQGSCIVPSLAPPPQTAPQCSRGLTHPGEYLKPCPLTT